MDTKDYIKIFQQSSELLVVIDTNFAIVAASDAFLKATTTVRENILGRNAFDVFPDNPDDKTANGESIVRASFNRVIKNKTKDVLPVVKYDIPKPESEGGGYELKYWQATSSPILDENNNVKYIIHRTEDVTENKMLITQLEVEKKTLKLLEDSEKRHNMMLMKSPFAFAVLKGENKVITFANDKMKATWGKGNNVEGKPLIEVLPELKDTPFPNLLDEVYKTGIPYHANDVLAPKYINGQKEDVYYNFVYQPYLEADETISGVTIIAAEVTASVLVKKALEAQHEVEQKALKQIEDSEKRYNMMLMKSPFGFAIFKGKNMVITLANDSVKEMWGKGKDLEGKSLFDVIPELKDSEFPDLLDKVYTTGVPFYGEELLAPVFRNGKLEDVYFNFVYQPYMEADETISGVTVIAYEVTASVIVKKALEAQREAEKKALKLVEETNKRYHLMLMQSPFAFSIMKGKDMVVTLANDSMKKFWGKGNEVEGKTLLQVLPELKDQPFPAMIDSVYNTGMPVYANEILARLQYKEKMKDRYFNIVYQPHHEADGTISGVITIAYEVTEMVLARKKIEESEGNLRQVLDSMPQKITNADTEGNVIYFNKKWLDDTGLEFEKLKGWGWEKVIHPDDVEITKTKWTNSFQTGDVFDMECRILNKEGEYRWHLSRALPIKDENGKIKMWVGTNTEIHEQKEQKEVLEKEVERRTKQLKQKNIELENANKDLTAFTYISSHDLQEPLRKIQDFVAVILKEEEQNLSNDGKGYFVRMQQTAKRMQTLIEDLLAYSRASNSEKIFEKIDLNIILDEVKKDFGEDIQQKKATIEAAGLCEMDMIRFQFRQLLHNLIGNSLKFSKENTAPHITITSKIEKGSTLNNEKLSPKTNYYHIIFTDNGIGFKPEYEDRIFEVFQRLHSIEEYRGTGIGLAICKRIVENHKGIITATGELNKGAKFDIYIPA